MLFGVGVVEELAEQGGDQIGEGLIGLQSVSLGAQVQLAGEKHRKLLGTRA